MEAERAASWAFRSRGLVGAVLALAFGALVLFSPPAALGARWNPVLLEALGWLVFVAGAALRFWATLYIGGRKRRVLVCEGPYSLCRNPLYVGTFLIALSAAIMLESLTFASGVLLGAAFYAWATVPAEERYLANQLGEPYRRYCQSVPRFFPAMRNFSTGPTISVDVRSLWCECRRASRWIWLPVLLDAVSRVRGELWWPHWLNLP
ncbi:MAG TPA: isoprenylcysteine carboxylmethyltransferase family protein [Pirellulales bacterium]|nr:isoprenylcysteine carboxylmethyltransferase family protein [Pirellulales bacterium]